MYNSDRTFKISSCIKRLVLSQGELKMETKEELVEEGYNYQWFQYVQYVLERYKEGKKLYGFEELMSIRIRNTIRTRNL